MTAAERADFAAGSGRAQRAHSDHDDFGQPSVTSARERKVPLPRVDEDSVNLLGDESDGDDSAMAGGLIRRESMSRVVLQVRLFLPMVLLLAAYLHFAVPGVVYLAVFFFLLRVPHYSFNPRSSPYPYSILVFLVLYSLTLMGVHIALAVMVSRRGVGYPVSPAEESLGVPRYDVSVWLGLRTLLGHLAVLIMSAFPLLGEHPSSQPGAKSRYIGRGLLLLKTSFKLFQHERERRRQQDAFYIAQSQQGGGAALSLWPGSTTLLTTGSTFALMAPGEATRHPPSIGGPALDVSPPRPRARGVPTPLGTFMIGAVPLVRRFSSSTPSPRPVYRREDAGFRQPTRRPRFWSMEMVEARIGDNAMDEEEMLEKLRIGEEALPQEILRAESHGQNRHGDPSRGDSTLRPVVDEQLCRGPFDYAAMAPRRSFLRRVRSAKRGSREGFDVEASPGLSELAADRDLFSPPTRLTTFMAGHGGVLWSCISVGLAGISYSSIITLFFLVPVLVYIVVGAFKAPKSWNQDHPDVARKILYALRGFLAAYLAGLYVFQFGWLRSTQANSWTQLVGFVLIDTGLPGGWANVMAVSAAVAAYVFTGMHSKAVSGLAVYNASLEMEKTPACRTDSEACSESTVHSAGMSQCNRGGETDCAGLDTGKPGTEESRDCNVRRVELSKPSPARVDGERNFSSEEVDVRDSVRDALQFDNASPSSGSTESSGRRPDVGKDTLLRIVLHASSLGLLIWPLVFPGLLSLPMIVSAVAYFSFRWWWSSLKADYIVVYAVVLQIVCFLYVATTDAFGIADSRVIHILGFRRFEPQIFVNLIQSLAVGLLCIHILAKRRLRRTQQASQTDDMNLRDILFFAAYSVQAKQQNTAFSPIKVVLDQLALASLYVSGGTNATALNAVFLLALAIICFYQGIAFFEALAFKQHRYTMSVVWTGILIYSSVFLLVNGIFCRASSGLWTCSSDTIGIVTATNQQTAAYSVTVVLAALQRHFTWPWGQDNRDAAHVEDFQTKFWEICREYFVYFAYTVLLLYPIVFPANYLSYVYMVFLLVCIMVETLVPHSTDNKKVLGSRRIIRGYWPVVVVFSGLVMLTRYFVRFSQFMALPATQRWVFGLDRGFDGFAVTLGDAIVLIVMSLQGRLFIIDRLVMESQESENLSTEGSGYRNRNAVVAAAESDVEPSMPVGPRPTLVEFDGIDRAGAAGDAGDAEGPSEELKDLAVEDPMHNQASIAQAVEIMRKLRKTLPVERTQSFLLSAYGYLTMLTRWVLLGYDYVLEALAILAAAVWLDSISVFGAVYLIAGCVLLLAPPRRPNMRKSLPFQTTSGDGHFGADGESGSSSGYLATRILPPVLVILSFSLMSLQYLYIILTSSGTQWGALADYFGLEAVPLLGDTGEPDLTLQPIKFNAMLAHVLVLVTAFLQRAAVRWLSADERRARIEEEEQDNLRFVADPLQNGEALGNAVPISDVFQSMGLGDTETSSTVASAETEGHHVRFAFSNPAESRIVVASTPVEPCPPCDEKTEGVGSSPHPNESSRTQSFHLKEPKGEVLPSLKSSRSFCDFADGDSMNTPESEKVGGPVSRGVRSNSGSFFSRHSKPLKLSHAEIYKETKKTAHHVRKAEEAIHSVLDDNATIDVGSRLHGSQSMPTDWQNLSPGLVPSDEEFASRNPNNMTLLQRARSTLRNLVTGFWSHSGEIFSLLTPFWQNWGFDLTFIYLVVGGTISETVFSAVYVLFVFALSRLDRNRLAANWRLVTLVLVTLVLTQYGLTLGLPPSSSVSPEERFPETLSQEWAEWLYLDSFSRTVENTTASIGRKAGITFGFLAVICAGITLKSLPGKGLESGLTDANSNVYGVTDQGSSTKFLGLQDAPEHVPVGHRGYSRGAEVAGGSRDAYAITGVIRDGDESSSHSGWDGIENTVAAKAWRGGHDFTQRPLSFKNWVKLSWMKFAGSAVQLFMLAVAAVDTNVLSAILLLMSFYFFIQFSNLRLKQTRFLSVRLYVLFFVFVLVVYQAPFNEEGAAWARIVGLYKTSSGNGLLFALLALWMLCQMQARIYESKNFVYVVRSTEEDEKVRWRRAIHEHNNRIYERMLGRNKNKRAKHARKARVDALEALRVENKEPPTELFFRVCVTNWVEFLKKRSQSAEYLETRANERRIVEEEQTLTRGMGRYEKLVRWVVRGSKWRKHAKIPFALELRGAVLRYSSWPVYFTMILAAVVVPSILTIVYPLVLFIYVVVESPRPPKQVWTVLILYVYFVILFKYVGRKPEFVSYCDAPVSFWGNRISDLNNQPSLRNFSICGLSTGLLLDLLVLLALLSHRTLLYYRGLWDLPQSEEELRLRELITCEKLSSTSPDMKFSGFDDLALVGPRKHDQGPQERDSAVVYSFSSASEQFAKAEQVLTGATEATAALAPRGSEELAATVNAKSLAAPLAHISRRHEQGTSKSKYPSESKLPVRSGLQFRSDGEASYSSRTRQNLTPSKSWLYAQSGTDFETGASRGEGAEILPSRSQGSISFLRERTSSMRRRKVSDSGLQPREHEEQGPRESRSGLETGAARVTSEESIEPSTGNGMTIGFLKQFRNARLSSSGFGLDPVEEVAVETPQTRVGESLLAGKVVQQQLRPESGAKGSEVGGGRSQGRMFSVFSASRKEGPFSPIREHFRRLLQESEHKTVGDYYLLIFSVDFACFVFMVFGYSAIIGGDSVQRRTWWQNNFIETSHLLTLLGMFFGIVLDRIVYLRRSMIGKLVIQYVSVIVYHYFLFYRTNIGLRPAAKAFYALKCIYFLLSGLQIRTGFPLYTTGQYLLRNYSTLGLVLFEIYNYIPFLWLARTLLDWAVVETSLEIFQYFRFVDIYLWLYRNRAINTSRGLFRRVLGQKRRMLPRVYQGAGMFLIVVILLFFPFFLFSFLNPFFEKRAIIESTLATDVVAGDNAYRVFSRSIRIDGPLDGSAESDAIRDEFRETYMVVPVVGERQSLFQASFDALSESFWLATPADIANLVDTLNADESEVAEGAEEGSSKLSFTLTSMTSTQVFRTTRSLALNEARRNQIADALDNTTPVAILLDTPLPKYLLLNAGANEFEAAEDIRVNKGTCLRLLFSQSGDNGEGGLLPFWSVEDCVQNECNCAPVNAASPAEVAAALTADGSAVQLLLQIADVSAIQFGGGTILTLYAAILFTVASIARGFLSNKRLIIPYIDMPYTLHLYQLVLDIVYARQDRDLVMEEILYNGLTDIYRDPSEIARWTGQRSLKPPHEWWEEEALIEGYEGYPSFRETETEPYIDRIVE